MKKADSSPCSRYCIFYFLKVDHLQRAGVKDWVTYSSWNSWLVLCVQVDMGGKVSIYGVTCKGCTQIQQTAVSLLQREKEDLMCFEEDGVILYLVVILIQGDFTLI